MTIGLSGNVLPIHPQPKPDEIFSSWYCRVARENSLKLHTLEVKLWGRDKQIWTRDIDRSIDDATLAYFASICGTSFPRARETCLGSYEGILFRELNLNGNSNWVLPAGIYHRKRRRSGMQFCPYCLGTDAEPYFRKSWRLALATMCELHGTMLHDCCPDCKAPVTYHRHEMGQRWLWQVESLTLCTRCGFDLRRAPAYGAPVVEIHAWMAFRNQLTFLDMGWTFVGNETFHYSHLYFDALRNFLRKLRSRFTTRRLREAVEKELGIEFQWISPSNTLFEFCGVMERHCLLQIAIWLLMDWPNRMQRVARETKIRFSELMREFDNVPFWFWKGTESLECKPVGPCQGEREAMRQLLIQSVDDEIRLDILKRNVYKRLANQPIRELWIGDGLPFPGDVAYGTSMLSEGCSKLGGPPKRVLPPAQFDSAKILVVATASAEQNGTYGLRVCASSREDLEKWFSREWRDIEIEMDGEVHSAKFRTGFWEENRELRCPMIRRWLEKRGFLSWPCGRPPEFELIRLRERLFRLLG